MLDHRLTIVIPTLGGNVLSRTINSVMTGSLVPAKVLLVVPTDRIGSVPQFNFSNIEVLETVFRGQVKQRIAGFSRVKTEFVMQLDDDIELSQNCVEVMMRAMQSCSSSTALSSSLFLPNHKSIFFKKRSRLYYWLLNGKTGYKAGSIYLSGSAEGAMPDQNNPLIKVDWLPGGCILHRTSNLVLDNFFPFEGKAYCEDLIHSVMLRKKKVSLFFVSNARATLEMVSYTAYDLNIFIKSIVQDYHARRLLIKLLNIKSKRIYIFYIIIILNYLCSLLLRRKRNEA